MRLIIPQFTWSEMDEFWSLVDKNGDCWEWTGGKNSWGYGMFKTYLVHRVAYAMAKGQPGALCVCHQCDNTSCVNPDHLWLATVADNNRDCINKGRHGGHKLRGEGHGRAKLTEAQVVQILQSDDSQQELGIRFGVATKTISDIKCGNRWKHVKWRLASEDTLEALEKLPT